MPDSVFVWTAGDVLGLALFAGLALCFAWAIIIERWRQWRRKKRRG